MDFVVYDAKTNDDITRTVLTQIIFEEESQGQSLLPIEFLRQLIGFYGNSMQAFLPSYLELSLSSFTQQQERMRTQFSGIGQSGGHFEEQIRQNLQLFDKAMKMFSPFAYAPRPDPTPPRRHRLRLRRSPHPSQTKGWSCYASRWPRCRPNWKNWRRSRLLASRLQIGSYVVPY